MKLLWAPYRSLCLISSGGFLSTTIHVIIWFFSFNVILQYLMEKKTATHSSILARRIPWAKEPGLQSIGLQKRVGHNWAKEHTHAIPELFFLYLVNLAFLVLTQIGHYGFFFLTILLDLVWWYFVLHFWSLFMYEVGQ